ncbi:non-homologous end-joining DNA ligase [Streptantibioticus rubrisoli]|uniref:Non-homologous end-joining DNA ligase n=1 Tax=Streptantibioticus rubrisoli TaxID=1387313 RepID=A0ABT1P5R1_9ACTN|nr:non-homologous end-joining DNA ligase [Streptantibioticus rubrisoli]MCQ4040682.1 non-homologous end-joining DNA ligase [Streptantibioticus rubrisoli]
MPVAPDRQALDVDGHRLILTHLNKVLFPRTGTTKAAVLHYFVQVAPEMLDHCAGRPASFVRAPDGPDGQTWYAKNPPPGLPDWVTVTQVASREGSAPYVVIDSTASLLAMVNLGAYEIHVPQWTAAGGPNAHDRLVFDLDPGEGVDLVLCCRIAGDLRQLLAEDGLRAHPVVSGSKGLHLYVPLRPAAERRASDYAKALAVRMQRERPDLVTAVMARAARPGKVFIDWSQNASAKTTAAPYTLRVRPRPAVTAPVTWDEVTACEHPDDLRFTPEQVAERVTEQGDVLADLADPAAAADLPDPVRDRRRG